MKWWPRWLRLPDPDPPEALREAEVAKEEAEKALHEVKKRHGEVARVVSDLRKEHNDNFSKAMDVLFRGGHA